jgi:hypothetical protein
MAQRESNREDLMREATALAQRAELMLPGAPEPIVVGFRRDGGASFFLGADPALHFNSAGELRRAYVDGQLYKAVKGRLVAMRRERTATETVLLSRELSSAEADGFLAMVHQRLAGLREFLSRGDAAVLRQVPDDADLLRRILDWLSTLPAAIPIADAPNVR